MKPHAATTPVLLSLGLALALPSSAAPWASTAGSKDLTRLPFDHDTGAEAT